jgi:hypothetical protein
VRLVPVEPARGHLLSEGLGRAEGPGA